MSYTRVQVRQELARRHPGLGRNFTVTSGDTDTILASELLAVQNQDLVVPGAVIYINKDAGGSNAAPEGSVAWVETAPSTPASITVEIEPAISAVGPGDTGEVWHRDLQHIDRVNECIDRALTNRCHRWVKVPITLLPDGDMEKTATTAWTASSADATLSKVALTEGNPVRQTLCVLNGTLAGYAYQRFYVQPDENFSLVVLCRSLLNAAHTPKVVAQDATNSAAITLSGDGEEAETGLAWQVLRNTFTIPTACKMLDLRLGVKTAGDDAIFGWAALTRQNDREVVLPDRVNEPGKVGKVFKAVRQVSTPYEPWGSWDLQEVRGVEKFATRGTGGVTLRFPSTLGSDLYFYEEWQGYEALTETVPATATSRNQNTANDDANTTNADLDWVVEAAALECYLLAYNTWRAGNATRVASPGMPTSDPNPWRFQLMQQAAKVYQLNKNMTGEPQTTVTIVRR